MTGTVNQVVIVGRDVPLWLSACVLQSALGPTGVRVTAVELPSHLTASDACVAQPALEALHHRLRLDESLLLSGTSGAFSLGQNFVDASGATPSFFHAYGAYGATIDSKAFFPYWLMARGFGLKMALEEFSLTAVAARHGRMVVPDPSTESFGRTDYGYHLPAINYAAWLKKQSLRRGVSACQVASVAVTRDPQSGDIVDVVVDEGRRIAGQLFVDATGVEAQLLCAELRVQRDSWVGQFPADRCIVGRAGRLATVPPYAEVRASIEGWAGLHPSRAATHLIQVYRREFTSDEDALRILGTVCGLSVADATVRAVLPARASVAWDRNCVAVGAAACSFDPVHGVELHALQMGLMHLLALFPVCDRYEAERDEYNRTLRQAFERIRDYQVAHYALSRYPQSPFWERSRRLDVSSQLAHKVATFDARGQVPMYENETFTADSWQALLVGHGRVPHSWDPIIERTPPEIVKREFRRILGFIRDKVQEQATHDFYLQAVCSRNASSPGS